MANIIKHKDEQLKDKDTQLKDKDKHIDSLNTELSSKRLDMNDLKKSLDKTLQLTENNQILLKQSHMLLGDKKKSIFNLFRRKIED